MSARRVMALPVYGMGYGLLIACGLIAALGALILGLADYIVTHKRVVRPWDRG